MPPKQSSGVTSKKCTSENAVGNKRAELTCNKQRQENRNESGAELQFEDQSSRMPLKKILAVYAGIGEETYPEFNDTSRIILG
jgi:hypothetical protein